MPVERGRHQGGPYSLVGKSMHFGVRLEFESIFHHLPFFEKNHFIFQSSRFLIKLEKASLVPYLLLPISGFYRKCWVILTGGPPLPTVARADITNQAHISL